MFKFIVRDSFFTGIIIGMIFLAFAYFSFVNFEKITEGWSDSIRLKLLPPRLQLIILALELLLFRFIIVKWNRIKIAKGMFLILFISTIAYIINYRNNFFE